MSSQTPDLISREIAGNEVPESRVPESAPQLIVAEFRCPSHVERLQAVQPAAVGTNK